MVNMRIHPPMSRHFDEGTDNAATFLRPDESALEKRETKGNHAGHTASSVPR